MEWVCETPGESDKQVAEAVIPALKDKSIEVLFFLTFRTLKMRQIGGRYSGYGVAAFFVNIRVKKHELVTIFENMSGLQMLTISVNSGGTTNNSSRA